MNARPFPARILFVTLVLALTSNSIRADEINIQGVETETGVTFSFSGSIDTTGFPMPMSILLGANFGPMNGVFLCGALDPGPYPDSYAYGGVVPGSNEDKSFGTGPNMAPSTIEGDPFGFNGATLYLPEFYVSGTPISGSMFHAGQTFATLGVNPVAKSFNTSVGTNTISYSFPMPSDNSAIKIALQNKIKKLQKKVRKLKKRGKKAKAKKLLKKVKKLKRQLAASG